MQKGANILALGEALDAALAEFQTELPRGVTIGRIADQPAVVDKAVNEFTRSFVEALAIVLAVSVLSLSTGEKGIMSVMASIRKRNDWDDPEANKADKEDDLALLSAFVAIVLIWGAAFLLT